MCGQTLVGTWKIEGKNTCISFRENGSVGFEDLDGVKWRIRKDSTLELRRKLYCGFLCIFRERVFFDVKYPNENMLVLLMRSWNPRETAELVEYFPTDTMIFRSLGMEPCPK